MERYVAKLKKKLDCQIIATFVAVVSLRGQTPSTTIPVRILPMSTTLN